jgi:hypothetical protein
MELTAFLEDLKALTSREELISANREVNELRTKFEDYIIEEERKLQVAQLEAQEKGEAIPEQPEFVQMKEDFYAEITFFKGKRKLLVDAKNEVQAANLTKKASMIKRLREIIQTEENIGAAFGGLKEIQEQWKDVGDIPRESRDEIQTEYSRLIEDFFYNINIYKQLKDHDLHRNTQMKLEVIEKMQGLVKLEALKDVETQLKALQNEWEDIGPVTNGEWEVMKDNYWKAVRLAYDRINAHYEQRRAGQLENLAQKQALVSKVKLFVEELPVELDQPAWESNTATILGFQEEWKKIGFGPKKENEEVWKEFRGQCDVFFNKKKAFYGVLQQEFSLVANEKSKLIEKAEALKDSTDWKESANQIIQLQKSWKELGHSGQKNEQKLWKSFRAACDSFFNARTKHFEAADAEFEGNLGLKEALIVKMEAYTPNADKKLALADLKQFSAEFSEIGKVPMKTKDTVYNKYKAILDALYGSLKLEGAEKNKIMFQAKIDTLSGSSDSGRMLANEKMALRKQIETIKAEINQLENNLGFFAKSKGADALKADVAKKVEKANGEIETIKQKIKMIPNE